MWAVWWRAACSLARPSTQVVPPTTSEEGVMTEEVVEGGAVVVDGGTAVVGGAVPVEDDGVNVTVRLRSAASRKVITADRSGSVRMPQP